MNNIVLQLFAGIDFPIKECQLIIHQPTIREIAYIGEDNFFSGVQWITIDKNLYLEDRDLLNNINNFQIFMTVMSEKITADKKENVMSALNLFFPDYKILLTPQSIVFSTLDGSNFIIDQNNFDFFQNAIEEICCLKNRPDGQNTFNPIDETAAEISKKLMKGREKVAKEKGEKGENTSIFSQYISILSIGNASNSLNELLNLTIFQLYDQIERYQLYVAWNIDIRSRLAGGKPEEEPDDWMKNIH